MVLSIMTKIAMFVSAVATINFAIMGLVGVNLIGAIFGAFGGTTAKILYLIVAVCGLALLFKYNK